MEAGAGTPTLAVPRLAILDLAGTTVAVGETVPEALRGAFEHAGISLPDSAIPGIRGRSKDEAIRQLVETLAPGRTDIDELSRTIFAHFRATLLETTAAGVTPIRGASDTIDWLRANGATVFLTTGFDRELAARIVDQLGWTSDRINGLITADDVARGRPDPDLVFSAMRLSGVTDPAAVIVVGDTAADLVAGWRAGVYTVIGVLSGAHTRQQLAEQPHTAILDSVADLPAWLIAGRSPPGPATSGPG